MPGPSDGRKAAAADTYFCRAALGHSLSLELAHTHNAKVFCLLDMTARLLLLSYTRPPSCLILREVKDRKSLFCT